MKYLFTSLLFSLLIISGYTQDRSVDQELIDAHILNTSPKEGKVKGGFYALYKNHISRQILNDCVYDHSCSTFSKDVFEHFGIIKGLFLTADRLTRCNRASLAEISSSRINDHGKAIDHWDHYEKNH